VAREEDRLWDLALPRLQVVSIFFIGPATATAEEKYPTKRKRSSCTVKNLEMNESWLQIVNPLSDPFRVSGDRRYHAT